MVEIALTEPHERVVGRSPLELQADFVEHKLDFSELDEIWWYVAPDKHNLSVTKEPKAYTRERMERFTEMLRERDEDCIVVVGHSHFIKTYTKQSMKLPNCGMYSYELE